MSTTHELSVLGAAVLVTVSERDELFTAKVNGMPEVQAVATTREGVLRKIAHQLTYAVDQAA